MEQVIYAMRFTGKAEPVEGESRQLRADTESPSSLVTSVIDDAGVRGEVEEVGGQRACFESKVAMTSASSFQESGSIRFGENGHLLRFSTLGEGHVAPSPAPGLVHGSVVWRVDGGEGQFAGASGLITSNFTLSDAGEVIDNQFGVIWTK